MAKTKKYTFRQLINDLHLWLGIASSAVLFIVCLTGTIYTFKSEIEEWLEPEKYHIEQTNTPKKPIAQLVQATEEFTKGKANRITFTESPHRPYEINVVLNPENKRGETFLVNPYTSQVIGPTKGKASEFFMTIFKLHRWLLFDMETGRPIVGTATLIFVFLCISGLILWLPKKIKGLKSFKPGLKIMWRAKWKRINHDLHNTLGFYTLFLLFIMSLTGLFWSFDWYKDLLSIVLQTEVGGPKKEEKEKKSTKPKPESPVITYEEALLKAEETFPYQGKTIISTPAKKGEYEVTKYNKNRLNKEAADKITIDAISGHVNKTEVFDDLKTGEKIAKQIKAIHLGTIYGSFSKWLYFIACLIATTLPITGIFIWLNKMKKKPKSAPVFKK